MPESELATPDAPGPEARFLATMSHEFRTPLNVVIGFSDTMMQNSGPTLGRDQVSEYAAAINQAGRQLLAMVDLILDVVQADASPAVPADLVDVAHLVSMVMAHAAADAAAAELTICETIAPKLPLLRGDEKRLRHALTQMVSNAVKFTPNGGSVSLDARLEEGSGDLLLSVQDTGIGVPDHELQRVFEPFVQLDATLARRFSGSGLGLYAARLAARANGGDLVLASAPGAGVTALLRLPASRLVVLPPPLLP